MERHGRTTRFYCRNDKTYHYKSELPRSLQPFVNYEFSSGIYTGDDFEEFNIKFKKAIEKKLPENYKLYSWNKGHYYCYAVIKDNNNRFIYMSIPDVRFFPYDWIEDILIRTMSHKKDWKGGHNHRTDLINFTKDIQKLYGGK